MQTNEQSERMNVQMWERILRIQQKEGVDGGGGGGAGAGDDDDDDFFFWQWYKFHHILIF